VLRTDGDIVRATSAENMTSFRYGMKCFFEEGRALAKINHPNVVRVLNFFRANETVYMVMRYERGRTLQQQIQMRQDQMSERLVRHVFMHLLNGLREVHTHKLLHLDIKPANIYLRTDGSPVLLDFGAARQTLTTQRPKLAPMYTPGFAAPEQYKEPDRLGPWTDVYGTGASMFACLAAFAPQAADARLQEDHLVSAKRIWAGQYSDNVLEVIDWCLRLDPLERPQSVFALQKAIRDIPPKKRKLTVLGNLKRKLFTESARRMHAGRCRRRSAPFAAVRTLTHALHHLPGIAQGFALVEPGPDRLHVQPRHAAARRGRRHGRTRGGEIAAQIAVRLFIDRFQQEATPILKNPLTFLHETMVKAHAALGSYSAQFSMLETPRTTCVACVVQGGHAYWVHVGDSRLYLYRRGALISQTRDHSKVQYLVDQGLIGPARWPTIRIATRSYSCLGGTVDPVIDLSNRTVLRDGDIIVLCTDGLWGSVPSDEIATWLTTTAILKAAPEMMREAERRGGLDGDNLSAIVVRWGPETEIDEPSTTITETLPLGEFATQIDSTLRSPAARAPSVISPRTRSSARSTRSRRRSGAIGARLRRHPRLRRIIRRFAPPRPRGPGRRAPLARHNRMRQIIIDTETTGLDPSSGTGSSRSPLWKSPIAARPAGRSIFDSTPNARSTLARPKCTG
jgi:serine/threonine protein phosphatase PrpC